MLKNPYRKFNLYSLQLNLESFYKCCYTNTPDDSNLGETVY